MAYSKDDLSTEIEETGWTTAIETGIDLLDGQHRKYFNFVNTFLAKATTEYRNDSDLVESLDFLIRYAMEHFSTEQRIMKQKKYPGYQEHFEEHMYFLKHVGALRNRISVDGHNDELTREVRFYTLQWFVQHIQSADMKLVAFLNLESDSADSLQDL